MEVRRETKRKPAQITFSVPDEFVEKLMPQLISFFPDAIKIADIRLTYGEWEEE